MRAQRIIQSGAFTPEDLKRLQTAFDTAWAALQHTVDASEVLRARETLATVVVTAGEISELDSEELAAFAVRTFKTIREANPPC